MPFVVINETEVEVGAALKKELLDKIKGSLDDHELRLNSSEAGSARVVILDTTIANAAYASSGSITGIAFSEALFPYSLTGCEIRIFETGSLTGSLEIDIKKSTTGLDDADFNSVFTTQPSVDYSTASDYDRSINQVFNPSQISIDEGDTLRLDITSLPSGGILGKFRIILYGEV